MVFAVPHTHSSLAPGDASCWAVGGGIRGSCESLKGSLGVPWTSVFLAKKVSVVLELPLDFPLKANPKMKTFGLKLRRCCCKKM